MIRDDHMRLRDGQTLAYTTIGAPDGLLVLDQHGAPGGRFELLGLDEALARRP